MVGQRVKEKRAATLESGCWQGTSCPLGYVVKDDRLVVDQVESKVVQEIFTRYANEESVTAILNDLNARGVNTKRWRTRAGKLKGGKTFNRNAIYTLLKNRVYLGEVFYDDAWRDGAHEPIIDRDLWNKVTVLLDARSRRGESRPSSDEGSIFMLRGRVFGADGRAMSPWLSSAYKGRKYAYYQLIDKVTVHADRLNIFFSLDGLMAMILELLADRPELVRTYRQLYSSARSHGL
ncbi:recombinase family protein [Marinagarivorans algicola]